MAAPHGKPFDSYASVCMRKGDKAIERKEEKETLNKHYI